MPSSEVEIVSLTPIASQQLKKLLAEKELKDHGLRVFISGGGCGGMQYGMAFDNKAEEGDFVCEVDGVKVIVDSASSQFLEGAKVDFVDSLMGGGFKVENPNATMTCSCGQSFAAGVREDMGGGNAGCGHCS